MGLTVPEEVVFDSNYVHRNFRFYGAFQKKEMGMFGRRFKR
jgi:hypothetical protein